MIDFKMLHDILDTPEMRRAQRKIHHSIYRPYRPTITWAYKTASFNFCAEDCVPHYNLTYDIVQVHRDSEPYVWVHEIGHFLYTRLPVLMQKNLQTEVIQMCYSLRSYEALIEYVTTDAFHNSSPYEPLIDAYRVLYNPNPDICNSIGHPFRYGIENPVYYATTEAWAGACEYFMLRVNEEIPPIAKDFFEMSKQYLKWLDKNKVYHRSK